MAALKAAETRPGSGDRPGLLIPSLVGLTLLALLLGQYPHALRVPFINDDYIFLEKTRRASFLSLWGLRDLAFHWYRPWSREFHYWMWQRLAGPSEAAFHVVSLALWIAVMLAYFAFARRFAGVSAAIVATAGAAVMSAWAVPILWIAGVQELWVLLFALLSLAMLGQRRIAASAAAFALALLSKETAAVLPAIAALYVMVIERRPVSDALRRTIPHWVLLAAWALVHPLIGGRLWHPIAAAPGAATGESPATAALRTLLSLVSLDQWPAPDSGPRFLVRALPALAVVVGLALLASRVRRADTPQRANEPRRADHAKQTSRANHDGARGAVAFGAAWAAIGWMPLFMPSLGWHAYYALLGSLGAWLALGALLARRAPLAIAALAACALLRSAQAETPSRDWGSAWYQTRAGEFLRFMRDDLRAKRPSFPAHSRLFFTAVPSNVGFMTTGAPALRVWYRDTTLSGGFYGDYRPRASAFAGEDFFFRYDSTAGWVEIEQRDDAVRAARVSNPRWPDDHRVLAALMAHYQDWAGSALQYRMLAEAFPESAGLALNTGLCYEMARDSASAARWYARATAAPGLSGEDRKFARGLALRFRSPP